MIFDSLYILSALIGYIISGILFTNRKSNPIMNIYIVLLIFVISTRYFSYGILNLLFNVERIHYDSYSNISFVVIPLCYLYFKKITALKSFEKKDLLHFIFPVAYFLLIFEINNYFKSLFLLRFVLYLIFVLFLIIYLYLSFKTLKNTIWNKKGENKFTKKQLRKTYHWTVFLFIAMLLVTLRLNISLFVELINGEAIRGMSYQWVSAIIWMIILVKIIVTPEILYGYKILTDKVQENRSSNLIFDEIWQLQPMIKISNVQHRVLKEKIDANLQNYFEVIEKTALEDKIFKDSKLTLTDLASRINIPKSHLSYVFKYHCSISFTEFKNSVRIHYAIKLINEGYLKNNTLDSLSREIGFTSYNPFFTSFKEIIGLAPNEYLNNIQIA